MSISSLYNGLYADASAFRSSIGIKTPKRVKKHHKTDVSSTPLLLHMNGTDD
ncbi:methionyl-tRNA formyltransferase [Escherichia coli]|nr:methionyl-tRNA formyltransferase [Escherichia coli]PAZ42874.1 methionyl-tRNA formyltransferase [Escherichia coli]PAZ42951.1 methionyl-tRNA formyltransferase [Escherichia coli]PAZ48159.1 methionyl-tRNA formyltransferase [Escherichia coli]PAZ53132.1 methionyl-tRNA formyltransferase [Escherichia coli]